MFERFTARMIAYIVVGLILAAAAVAIWDAIPFIIKIVAVIMVILGFVNIVKK